MIRKATRTILLAICLAAQTAGPLAAQERPPVAFLCEDESTAFVTFRDGAAEIGFESPAANPAILPVRPSGSGFLYEGAAGSLSGKGDEITWTAPRGAPLRCAAVAGGALVGPVWRVVRLEPADPSIAALLPRDAEMLSLRFAADGSLSAGLDCNRGMGGWRADPAEAGALEGGLSIGPVASTRAFCLEGGGLTDRFAADLEAVTAYRRTGDALHLSLGGDGGAWIFTAAAPQ